MARFYIDAPLYTGQIIIVTDPLLRHLQVLRIKRGEEVILFNNQGGEYQGHILSVDKKQATVEIDSFDPLVSRESSLRVTLIQALSKAERMDYTVQKATECGVYAIQPITSMRSQYTLPQNQAIKKLAHWQAVAIAASQQSGRTKIPAILPLQTLSRYLTTANEADLKIILSPTGTAMATQTFRDLPTTSRCIHVLVGPEGGLTLAEETQAIQNHFFPIRLGPRILRTETVTPVIMSLLQYRYGDF